MDESILLPLDDERLTLAIGGGKAANLTRLVAAGLTVPPGFVLTTAAYDRFVAHALGLNEAIQQTIAELDPNDPASLERASQTIRARFEETTMPPEIADALRLAYSGMGRPPVAVRSSATAEDLPEHSFAGQQDTFLHVVGDLALHRAVRRCWSSLWTARAIGYRERAGIPHEEVSLAVVVQEMVDSELSGVLFTANPLTGHRGQSVIDATLGLGEALVAGLVEPDHYVVESATGRLLNRSLGQKALSIRPLRGGGTVTRREQAADRAALDEDQLRQLAALGLRAELLFGSPQDMEWAIAGGTLYLLQSRPITALFPLPEGVSAKPLELFFSFGSVQGVLDPITPLGREAIRTIFAGAAALFGGETTRERQPVIYSAAERLWGNVTALMRHPLGRRALPGILGGIDPRAGDVLSTLSEDGFGPPLPLLPPPRYRRAILGFVGTMLRNFVAAALNPDRERRVIQRGIDDQLARMTRRVEGASTLEAQLALFDEFIASGFVIAVPLLIPRVLAGLLPLLFLRRLYGAEAALRLTRGLPHNVTTEMDLALWSTARAIHDDPESLARLRVADGERLGQEFLAGTLPPVAQQEVERFVAAYGMRGLAEIDFGRPRWRERPEMLFQSLKSYVEIDPSQAPDALFARGEREAERTLDRMVAEAPGGPLAPLVGTLVRALVYRVRALGGLRESPKFFIIRLMGLLRERLLESGQALVEAGLLTQADDLMYLEREELDQLARGATRPWKRIVAERRAAYARELGRRQLPRLLLSDGRAIYDGVGGDLEGEGVISGSPVSPGVVEGPVHVLLEPHGESLAPGEILVCPGTDPAWTPLFLAAGGLITEVGGMMTHGSVVAREYGIPAVVGVPQATDRLKSGQRIRLDGNSGVIVLLDEEE